MHSPAPSPPACPLVEEIRLFASPPGAGGHLVAVPAAEVMVTPTSESLLGWHQMSIGLQSSSAQRRRGLWVHREDWVSLNEESARRRMTRNSRTGYLAAVAVLWLPVHVAPDAEGVVVLGPSSRPAFRTSQWRTYRSLLTEALPQQPGLDYLFVQEYVRGLRAPAGRASWRHWVLENAGLGSL